MGRWQSVRALSAAAGALAASLVLVACTGDSPAPEPEPSPSEQTSSPTPTDEPTDEPTEPEVEEPELPDAATMPTRKGAEAFVEYYVEALNYSRLTGDVDSLRSATQQCRGCSLFADLYEETYVQGGSFEGFEWTFRSLVTYDVQDNYYSLATIKAAAGSYVEEDGVDPEQFLRTEFSYRFVPALEGKNWVMTEMVRTDV